MCASRRKSSRASFAGCELAGCALIGGETAEHPNAFPKDEYDLAGFALGVVEKDRIVDGRSIGRAM